MTFHSPGTRVDPTQANRHVRFSPDASVTPSDLLTGGMSAASFHHPIKSCEGLYLYSRCLVTEERKNCTVKSNVLSISAGPFKKSQFSAFFKSQTVINTNAERNPDSEKGLVISYIYVIIMIIIISK